jgi:hypothetical protein
MNVDVLEDGLVFFIGKVDVLKKERDSQTDAAACDHSPRPAS